MADQPRYVPPETGRFFADGRSAREPVPGTVARGQPHADAHPVTGLKPGAEAPPAPTLDRRGTTPTPSRTR